MDTIYQRVAGLDVHKTLIVGCLRVTGSNGKVQQEVRKFGTMTADLLELAEWLKSQQVTHVAMESTAVLWKPVWNILEAYDFQLLLVNARELKQVPGRKSDVKDSQWIAQLLACGLLKSSFVPPREQRKFATSRGIGLSCMPNTPGAPIGFTRSCKMPTSNCPAWPPTCWAARVVRYWRLWWQAKRIPRRSRNWRVASCGRRFRIWHGRCKGT